MEKKELFRIMAAADGSMLRELAQPLAEKYGVSVVKAPAKTLAVIDAAFNRQVSELDELKTVLQRLSMRQQREQELENGLYAKTMVDFQTMDQE